MDRDHRRMRLVLLLVIAINTPLLLIPFFQIADAIVATVATDKGPVIQHDHAGCSSQFIPKPTLLECYLHNLNLALHADVFNDGDYGRFCGSAYDYIIKNKKIMVR
jgi:hypothetical protein